MFTISSGPEVANLAQSRDLLRRSIISALYGATIIRNCLRAYNDMRNMPGDAQFNVLYTMTKNDIWTKTILLRVTA